MVSSTYCLAKKYMTCTEVINASMNLLFPVGLSDPFVIVELCPHHLFPNSRSQRTQVKLKTLHPVFDELFYL